MKQLITLLLLALLPFSLFSQSSLNPSDFVIGGELTAGEKLGEWISKDYSRVFTYEAYNGRLGVIGNEFQRIKVRFISVIRDVDEPARYMVYGKTNVMGNVCDFQGYIQVKSIREVKMEEERGELPNAEHGLLICEYAFFENPSQKHVGIFRGEAFAQFFLDEQEIAQYDDSYMGADGFFNNQFVGTWGEYGETTTRICRWGDYRIYQSGDLDGGAAEFAPVEKYHKFGWASYVKALNGDVKAQMEENKVWWE